MAYRLALLFALTALTALVYGPVTRFDFVSLDDPLYVTENPWVLRGLTPESVAWAWTSALGANWLPLTFLSHMLDVEWYGLDPSGHHRTNLVLHLASVVTLFGVLVSMTARPGRSAFVAGLFALHPIHVESVAWVTERKDVLSALFAFLMLAAWLGYVRRRGAARYGLVVLVFALGLLSKGMLVTLPFVLLLLDLWPLGRWQVEGTPGALRWVARRGHAERPGRYPAAPIGALLREKGPLFLLAGLCAAATYAVQQDGGAMLVGGAVPLPERLANAVYSVSRYLELAFWPVDLSIQRPHPFLPDEGGRGLPGWRLAASGVVVLAAGLAATWRGGAALVGFGWFLGMLVPVLGIVQVGPQGMADRYAYLPFVGLYLAVVWTLADRAFVVTPARRWAARGAALVVLVACAVQTSAQLQHWRGSEPLFLHAVEVDPGNHGARFALSKVYRAQGRTADAREQIEEVLALRPESPRAHNAMGMVRRQAGDLQAAAFHIDRALALAPEIAIVHRNRGRVAEELGRLDVAEGSYRRALELDPDELRARLALARLLIATERFDEALDHYRRALRAAPGTPAALRGRAEALAGQGKIDEAIAQYRQLVVRRPEQKGLRERLRALEAQARGAAPRN